MSVFNGLIGFERKKNRTKQNIETKLPTTTVIIWTVDSIIFLFTSVVRLRCACSNYIIIERCFFFQKKKNVLMQRFVLFNQQVRLSNEL